MGDTFQPVYMTLQKYALLDVDHIMGDRLPKPSQHEWISIITKAATDSASDAVAKNDSK